MAEFYRSTGRSARSARERSWRLLTFLAASLPLVLKQVERGGGNSVFPGGHSRATAGAQRVPAVPVLTLGTSLSAWRCGMEGHGACCACLRLCLKGSCTVGDRLSFAGV